MRDRDTHAIYDAPNPPQRRIPWLDISIMLALILACVAFVLLGNALF